MICPEIPMWNILVLQVAHHSAIPVATTVFCPPDSWFMVRKEVCWPREFGIEISWISLCLKWYDGSFFHSKPLKTIQNLPDLGESQSRAAMNQQKNSCILCSSHIYPHPLGPGAGKGDLNAHPAGRILVLKIERSRGRPGRWQDDGRTMISVGCV